MSEEKFSSVGPNFIGRLGDYDLYVDHADSVTAVKTPQKASPPTPYPAAPKPKGPIRRAFSKKK